MRLVWILLVLVVACGGERTRDLDCAREPEARRRAICNVVADHLKMSWGASRSLTPSYVLGARELPKVYCSLRLTREDAPHLRAMRDARREVRLAHAAGELLQLVAPERDVTGTRYDPADPRYLLKDGCRPPYSAERR